MNRQQIIRRMVLGAFAVTLALPGFGAAATVNDGGHDSGGEFKRFCADSGGIFIDTGDGNLWCQWGDGGQMVCDSEGQDCHGIPKQQEPSDPRHAGSGPGGEATTDVGETNTPAPVVDNPTSPAASQSVAPPDDDRGPDQEKSKAKKGKKGKKSGKGRK